MYVERIQLINCGPIGRLDITLPFNNNKPKPVVLVGENGSGKSIVLSNIVNFLLLAQGEVFPNNPEIEKGKVYKIRTSTYIKMGEEYYYSKTTFKNGLFFEELRTKSKKESNSTPPDGLNTEDAKQAWNKMKIDELEFVDGNILKNENELLQEFSSNCILYFPPDRFESPAWLNERGLTSKAEHKRHTHLKGYTDRKIIRHSPLHEIQNWIFEIVFDLFMFEYEQVPVQAYIKVNEGESEKYEPIRIQNQIAKPGSAAHATLLAKEIIESVLSVGPGVNFRIGKRTNRQVSINNNGQDILSNMFHLSTGQVTLVNLFLSIVQDYESSGNMFTSAADIRGIVVVDEIDLHLHSTHQYEILPSLISKFPNVQFVITSHSPLFVLGLQNFLGEDGFAMYRMPDGEQISPEEFVEFGKAYEAFKRTTSFAEDIRAAIENTEKPILYVEGKTDVKYLTKAAELLDISNFLTGIEIRFGKGAPELTKIWKALNTLKISGCQFRNKVVLLYDCDTDVGNQQSQKIFRRKISIVSENPIKKGIENLFPQETIDNILNSNQVFIDVTAAHKLTQRGVEIDLPASYVVNPDEKTNLCDWLCKNGTKEDFRHFENVFSILQNILGLITSEDGNSDC